MQNPVLRGLLRMNAEKAHIVELVVLALNQAPALNVQISFDPLPKVFAEHSAFSDRLPLEIPVIDSLHPFRMDISMFPGGKQVFGENPVQLKLKYKSVSGMIFEFNQAVDPSQHLPPMQSGHKMLDETNTTLKDLSKQIKQLVRVMSENKE